MSLICDKSEFLPKFAKKPNDDDHSNHLEKTFTQAHRKFKKFTGNMNEKINI